MNLSSMIEFEAFYENIPGALSLSSNGAVEKLFLLEKYFIRAPLLGTKTSCPSLSGAWPLVTTVAVHYRRPLISPGVWRIQASDIPFERERSKGYASIKYFRSHVKCL